MNDNKNYTGKHTTLTEQGFMINGKLEGDFIEYWDTGEIKMKTKFVNGKVHGEYIFYTRNGFVAAIRTYQNGLIVDREFDLINKPYIYNKKK